MLPVLAEALASIAMRAVQSLLPNTPADKLEILRLQIQADAQNNELLKGQMAINAAEAANDNLFVSGARPAVIWICAAGFFWQFVVQPILLFIALVVGHPIVAPVFDTVQMVGILSGLLGLGGMRSFDKYTETKTK